MSKPLTAEEGADRVQQRWKDEHRHGASAKHLYTCESCGGHALVLRRTYQTVQVQSYVLPCSCETADTAATREIQVTTTCVETSDLGEDHAPHEGEREIENEETEELDEQIDCERCHRRHPERWEVAEISEEETDADSDYTEVLCAECGHEIEFGYSHPEGGRIWPCEASDFNPWRCFPDRRFYEAWKRRGWIRPAK